MQTSQTHRCTGKSKYEPSRVVANLVKWIGHNSVLTIGTHDGTFHADELLCIAIITVAVSDYVNEHNLPPVKLKVVRSRDPNVLKSCDLLVDVGNGDFDHHGGEPTFYPNGIPMASCGKVLEEFETNPVIKSFLLGNGLYVVQAADNGYEGNIKWSEKGESHAPSMAYLNKTNPFAFVQYMNETYSEKFIRMQEGVRDNNAVFMEAYKMVEAVYIRLRLKIMDRITIREQMWSLPTLLDGKVLDLPDSSWPWQEFIFRTNPHGNRNIVAVIYPHQSDANQDGYCVRIVPLNIKGFGQRMEFPATWITWQKMGFKEAYKPSSASDFGCSYIHATGTFAVFDSKEHALEAVAYCTRKRW